MPKTIRFYKQKQGNDCGPVCLKMLMEYYGRRIPYGQILSAARLDDGGVSPAELIRLAGIFGFEADAYRLTYEELRGLARPVIALWHNIHYVVVTKAAAKSAWIANPFSHHEKYTTGRLMKGWDPDGRGGVSICINTPKISMI